MGKTRIPFGRKGRNQEEGGRFAAGSRNPETPDERRKRLREIRAKVRPRP